MIVSLPIQYWNKFEDIDRLLQDDSEEDSDQDYKDDSEEEDEAMEEEYSPVVEQ